MTAINDALFPIVLFVVYFSIALNFKWQPEPVTAIASVDDNLEAKILDDSLQAESVDAVVVSRDWLETQSLKNLKAIASELCINPHGNKSKKITWIEAIAAAQPNNNTLLAINLCYA